jgi:hypothetical protein
MGLEEIVADHAREVEAKSVLPRERPIVERSSLIFASIRSEGDSPFRELLFFMS